MSIAPITETKTGMSPDLVALLAEISTRRGSIQGWMRREHAVLVRISQCAKNERIWCRGEVHTAKNHYPALVVYNIDEALIKVLAPSGPDDAMEEYPHHLFSSTAPHVGIARGVLSEETLANQTRPCTL